MITKAVFIQSIKDFERYHGALEDCLKDETIKRFFLSDPLIQGYLSRSPEEVSFYDWHPVLTDTDNPAEYDKTDHDELRVYRLLPSEIPYRDALVTTRDFYKRGMDQQVSKLCEGAGEIS